MLQNNFQMQQRELDFIKFNKNAGYLKKKFFEA